MSFLGVGFLNAALLAGALAATVPVLIHLLSRRRRQRVEWGAMFLIEQLVTEDRRRIEIKQWILLALRCLAVLLFAIAMARPVLTHVRSAAGNAPADVVVVLDSSYSMSTADAPGGATRFAAARAATEAILANLPEGSDAAVLLAGDTVTPTDPAALKATEPTAGPAALARAVTEAADRLATSTRARREVIVVSDFQAADTFEAPGEGIDLTLIRPAAVTTAAPNVAVTDVAFTPGIPTANRPTRISVTLQNTGGYHFDSVVVRLLVDGIARGEQRLALRADAEATTLFVHTFADAGPHAVEVVVDAAGDVTPADDAFVAAVDVPSGLPVLVVAGDTELPFGRNPGDFLMLALDPSTADAEDAASLLRPHLVNVSQFEEARLDEYAAIVLADVPVLSAEMTERLRVWVEEGGALLIFPGVRADPEAYNGPLHVDSGGLFPARLAMLRTDAVPPAAAPYAHPALALWNEPGADDLSTATIRRHWELSTTAADIILSLNDGSPLIVERSIGRGIVIAATVPADGTWSDLPLRASFLPLVQQLTIYAIGRGDSPRTLRTGETIVLDVDQAGVWSVETPEGTRMPADVSADGRLRFHDTTVSGLYRVSRDGTHAAIFAVNANRDESASPTLDEEAIATRASAIGAATATGIDAYLQLDRERRVGRDAWRPVWFAVLATLFAELLLGGLLGREVSP